MTEEQIAINRLMCGNTAHSCKADYIKTAIKALEKQIPKKPIIKLHEYGIIDSYFCPDCDCYIRSTTTRKEIILEENVYCGSCGQKLDWE